MSEHIGAGHGVEARVSRERVAGLLVAILVQGASLAVAVGLILGVKQVVDGDTHGERLHAGQLEGVGQVEVGHAIGVEAVVLVLHVVEILAAHILRDELRAGALVVKREDVFITTKVMPSNYERAYQSIDDSLKRLNVDYIDLMLIHQSGSNDTEVYKALCQGVRDGKLRSIGISNYYTPEEYERVTAGENIKPAVVQNENHPFYQNTEFKEYVSKYGTVVESWYPFGGRGHTQDLFENETIMEIAESHGKTSAQIILRWHLQAGYITIPGSQNPDHILENISVFDFELTDEEMQRMTALHTGKRYENW